MKGFKAVNLDYRPLQDKSIVYQAGKTYEVEGEISPCRWGLHFCPVLRNVYEYYPASYCTRVFRVTALGQVLFHSSKCVTDELYIDAEMSPDEIICELIKGAATCSGYEFHMAAMKELMRSLMYGDPLFIDEEVPRLWRRWKLAMQAHASYALVQSSATATGYDLHERTRPIDGDPVQ